jgi:hypothetical protein
MMNRVKWMYCMLKYTKLMEVEGKDSESIVSCLVG